MNHSNRLFIVLNRIAPACLLLAAVMLASCGGSSEPEAANTPEAPAVPAEKSPSPAPPAEPASRATPDQASASAVPAAKAPASNVVEVRDDTPEAAIETWVNALRAFDFDAAIAVLDPDSAGTKFLQNTKAGYERAVSDPAVPIALMQTAIAGEIQNLSWEMSGIDGESATFRFTSKAKADPWEIRVVRTPDGWRVIPPPNGLPQG